MYITVLNDHLMLVRAYFERNLKNKSLYLKSNLKTFFEIRY